MPLPYQVIVLDVGFQKVLKREYEAGNGEFRARLVTCALTYLHREKFRSDLGVAFACPLTLTASEYPKLVEEAGGEYEAAQSIMEVGFV